MNRLKNRADTRLPSKRAIFQRIVSILPGTGICFNMYENKLLKAAFTLAYWDLLRVVEITLSNKKNINNILSSNDVHIVAGSDKLTIILRFSKTDQLGKGVNIEIPKVGGLMCPVEIVSEYLTVRPTEDVPFLCHFSESFLTRFQFSAMLTKSLKYDGIESSKYKAHSFRIGAAAALSMAGYPIDEINNLGRWKSTAYNHIFDLQQ